MVKATKIFKVNAESPDEEVIEVCARYIREGGLVVFPTETVYGLGANAYNPNAVKKIFIVKQRPMDNPLIVHIASFKQLYEVVSSIPAWIKDFLVKVWPGPLTAVLPKSKRIPSEVTAGLDTVAVRMPLHPVALKLIEKSGVPIAAPSANISGRPSPTTAQHVVEDLWGKVDVIIDAGETIFGVESTIIDLTREPPVLLRPGPYPVEKLREILGKNIIIPEFARGLSEADKALSPGMKYRHYAPRTPLILVELKDYTDLSTLTLKIIELAEENISKGKRVAILSSSETAKTYLKHLGKRAKIVVLGSRNNMYSVAKNLFKALRDLDKLNIDIALVEGFEEKGVGLAVMNRLRKASTKIIAVD